MEVKKMLFTLNKKTKKKSIFFSVALFAVFMPVMVFAQEKKNSPTSDSKILDDYITAKYVHPIVLSSSNIKQFWTEKTVYSKDETINILLEKDKSESLKIQLANVIETQDCKIDIIAESKDISFSVSNSNKKALSASHQEDDFIQYHVYSSSFHLEDTKDFSFYISFSSKNDSHIAIKRIAISFSSNPNSAFSGSLGFDALLEKIEKEGVTVPNTDVKYLVSEENHKVFFKTLNETLDSWFVYHVVPSDKKDLEPKRVQYGFNNYDFIPKQKDKTIIPKPYSNNSKYSIIQLILPSYQYSNISVGQSLDQGSMSTGATPWRDHNFLPLKK